MLKILPNRERVDDELVAAAARGGAALGGAAMALPELVALLSPEEPVDSLTERALMEGCAREVELGPFRALSCRAGFLDAALEIIGALKSGRCGGEELSRLAERASGPRAPRLQAMARLYSSYERALARGSAGDAADRLERAVARLRDARAPLPAALADAASVSFEDIYDLSPLRLELVLALAQRFEREGRGQRVRLLLPHDPERPELMAFVDPIWEEVYRRASEERALELAPKTYGDPASGPARLARCLFRRAPEAWDGPPAAHLMSCATSHEEVAAVARAVRARLAGGVPPEAIAVAVRQLDESAERLAEALGSVGVPARIRRGAPLRESRIARLALGLLELRIEGLSRDGLEAVLFARRKRSGRALEALRSTGLVHDEDAQGAGAFRRALALLAERAPASGRAAAAKALEALENVERALGALPRREAPLARHARGLAAALEVLAPLARRADPRCEEGGLWPLRSAAREELSAAALARCLSELTAAQAAAGRADEPIAGATFALKLEAAISERFLAPVDDLAAVRVVDVRELVGASYEHVFITGLVEGVFPTTQRSPELLSFEDLARINALAGREVFRLRVAPGGPVSSRLGEEPLLFHLALLSSRGSVTLSWSRADESGRERLTSRFVEEVRRLPGSFCAEVRPRSAFAYPREAATAQELLSRTALEHLAPAGRRASASDRTFDAAGTWEALRHLDSRRLRSVEERAQVQREREASLCSTVQGEPGPFTGGAQALAPALERHFAFDGARPLSSRVLALLGNCRFQGFAHLVLRVRAPRELGAQADPASLGELYHRALQRFFARAHAEGRLPVRGDADDLKALGLAIAEAAQSLAAEHPTGHAGLWSLALEEAEELLGRAVCAEAAEPIFSGLVPERFEAELGSGDLPLLPLAGSAGETPLLVGGRIDRIDAGHGRWAAVDYKSSRADSLMKRFKETFLRSEFQLALYAAALRHARPGDADAALMSLRDARPIRLSEILLALGCTADQVFAEGPEAERLEREEGIETLSGAVWRAVRDAREGRFAVRPVSCEYCGLGPLCRRGAPDAP